MLKPKGLEANARLGARFLRRKMEEFELLKAEIATLKGEIEERAAK